MKIIDNQISRTLGYRGGMLIGFNQGRKQKATKGGTKGAFGKLKHKRKKA